MRERIKKLWNALLDPPEEICWLLLGTYYGATLTFTVFMVAITYN